MRKTYQMHQVIMLDTIQHADIDVLGMAEHEMRQKLCDAAGDTGPIVEWELEVRRYTVGLSDLAKADPYGLIPIRWVQIPASLIRVGDVVMLGTLSFLEEPEGVLPGVLSQDVQIPPPTAEGPADGRTGANPAASGDEVSGSSPDFGELGEFPPFPCPKDPDGLHSVGCECSFGD